MYEAANPQSRMIRAHTFLILPNTRRFVSSCHKKITQRVKHHTIYPDGEPMHEPNDLQTPQASFPHPHGS
ncbi:hypothetical protein VTN49DRAFT_3259 [Thermomyces lanuginosus]|uniref:uncharacterized protein n=1 Tax=Thermomyces lanuginosus TaxID=5541 RepID=UPI0037437C4B